MKRLVFYILIAFLCTSTVFGAQPKYKIVDLGTLGGSSSYAFAINNAGQVVGRAEDMYGMLKATFFSSQGDGNNIDLGTLQNSGGESWAYAINNLGQVVGHDYDEFGQERAVLFDATGAGNNIALGSLGGQTGSAFAINDMGQIVGWSATVPDEYYYSNWHATLFDASGAGNNIELDKSAAFLSVARCINSSGQVAGNVEMTAYLFDLGGSGNNIDLGPYLTGDMSTVLAQNEAGLMVGYANIEPGYYQHAFVFSASGATVRSTDLGTLGGTASYATSVNASGQVVGYAKTAADVYHAAMFDTTGAGANIDLNAMIDPNLGWELMSAYINDKGQIAGYGKTAAGQMHAYLMTPVIEAKTITARVEVCPQTLNLASCGRWVICSITLPAGYKVSKIDRSSILIAGEVKAQNFIACDALRTAVVTFDRTAVKGLLNVGQHELKVTGKLSDGTKFSGTDSIRIINKGCGRK